MTFHVYTMFDADRRPLYVGQTGNLPQRMQQHRSNFWHGAVALVAVIPFATREDALKAEAWRIGKLRPLYNTQHNPRRMTVAEVIDRYDGTRSFWLLNGSRGDRHQWLREHPEATVRYRKWIALRDLAVEKASA